MKRVRIPNQNDDCIIDRSFEQFAQPNDPYNITISVDDNIYIDTSTFNEIDESELRRMEQHANFLLKSVQWIKYNKRKK